MNKRGQLQILLNPWILLGVGIFLVLLLLGVFFALKTLLAVTIVVAGLWMLIKGINPYVAMILVIIGALILWNPLEAFDFLAIAQGWGSG